MVIPMSRFVSCGFKRYSAIEELVFLQQFFPLQFRAAFAIVHLLHPTFFFRTITILCKKDNLIQLFFDDSFNTTYTSTTTFFFNNFKAN